MCVQARVLVPTATDWYAWLYLIICYCIDYIHGVVQLIWRAGELLRSISVHFHIHCGIKLADLRASWTPLLSLNGSAAFPPLWVSAILGL